MLCRTRPSKVRTTRFSASSCFASTLTSRTDSVLVPTGSASRTWWSSSRRDCGPVTPELSFSETRVPYLWPCYVLPPLLKGLNLPSIFSSLAVSLPLAKGFGFLAPPFGFLANGLTLATTGHLSVLLAVPAVVVAQLLAAAGVARAATPVDDL